MLEDKVDSNDDATRCSFNTPLEMQSASYIGGVLPVVVWAFNTPLEMHNAYRLTEDGKAAIELSILHWRCLRQAGIPLSEQPNALSILHWRCVEKGARIRLVTNAPPPFNTPLEMHVEYVWRVVLNGNLSILHWRCPLYVWPRRRLTRKSFNTPLEMPQIRIVANAPQQQIAPFNTPLEMPAHSNAQHIVVAQGFQYSIGDASHSDHTPLSASMT